MDLPGVKASMIVLTGEPGIFPVPTNAEAAQQPASITVYYRREPHGTAKKFFFPARNFPV